MTTWCVTPVPYQSDARARRFKGVCIVCIIVARLRGFVMTAHSRPQNGVASLAYVRGMTKSGDIAAG
jgi:hypothetical protein